MAKDYYDKVHTHELYSKEIGLMSAGNLNNLIFVLNSIGDAVIITDANGRIAEMNQVAEELTAWSLNEASGKKISEVFCKINARTRKPVIDPVHQVLKTGNTIGLVNHTVLINKEKKEYKISDSAAPILDEEGNISGVVLVFHDLVEEPVSKEEETSYLSYYDDLTKLYNRRFMEEEMKQLDNKTELPVGLIIGDLNGLKMINDTYGRKAGDELLIKTANILKASCREEDIVSRWGGDEFIILLPQTSMGEVQGIYKRIKEMCNKTQEDELHVSIAMGVGIKNSPDEDLNTILKEAEDKMYKNKLLENKSTKNNVLNALLTTLKEKSQETEEHAQRLKKFAVLLGKEINLPETELSRLELLASLHDIGKTIISDISEGILMKTGKLTDEEWELIKKHPEAGYRIASATEEFSHVAEDILSHHECWNGTGYPEGLKGEEIPLLARIISIVDAYDVMINGRNYKEPMSKGEVIEEIRGCAGSQFDPQLAEIFIKTIEGMNSE